MNTERRIAPREPLRLPLQLADGSIGLTRDLSAGGVFFETEKENQLQLGNMVYFEIALDTPEERMKLKAEGRIVRIESLGTHTGVGARLISSWLQTDE